MRPRPPVRFLKSQSDQTLLRLASRGYEHAFEALVMRHRKELVSHCTRMRLSPAAAEDAVQQGLLQAYLALKRGGEVREARAWLHRIVHNVALAATRSRPEHAPLDQTLPSLGTAETEVELRSDVRDALTRLAALPESQRRALLGHAADGLSHTQLAATLGLSPAAVRGLIYRARAALRQAATA